MGLLRPIYPMSREEHRGSNRFIIIMDAALKAELATTPRRRKEHRSNERRQTREGGIYWCMHDGEQTGIRLEHFRHVAGIHLPEMEEDFVHVPRFILFGASSQKNAP